MAKFEDQQPVDNERQPVAKNKSQKPDTGARGANGWRVRNLLATPTYEPAINAKMTGSTRDLFDDDQHRITVNGKPVPGSELPKAPPAPTHTPPAPTSITSQPAQNPPQPAAAP